MIVLQRVLANPATRQRVAFMLTLVTTVGLAFLVFALFGKGLASAIIFLVLLFGIGQMFNSFAHQIEKRKGINPESD